MPTRIYLPSSGSAPVMPSTWNFPDQINPLTFRGLTTKINSAMTTKLEATGTTSPTFRAMLRYVVGPLAAQTISGTVRMQMRAMESNAGANATLGIAVKIIQPNGADRAVLLAYTASNKATSPYEFSATTLTNRRAYNASDVQPIPLTSQNAVSGDYIVIEIGFRSATTTSRNISLRYGDTTTADMEDDTTSTNDYAPWVEFSQDLIFLQANTYTRSVSLDALAQKTEQKTPSLDSLMQKTLGKTVSIDSMIQKSIQGNVSLDSLMAKSIPVNVSIDGLIKAIVENAISLDALTQQSYADKTADIDGCIQSAALKSAALDAVIQKSLTNDAQLDALIQKAFSNVSSIDALLAKYGIETSISLDAILYGAATYTKDISIDALLEKYGVIAAISLDALLNKAMSVSASLDAAISHLDMTKNILLDALLLKEMTKNLSIDAQICKTFASSALMDGYISHLNHVSTILDAVLRRVQNLSTGLDALARKADIIKILSIDALIVRGYVQTAAIDSIINETLSRSVDMDAIIFWDGTGLTKVTLLDAIIYSTLVLAYAKYRFESGTLARLHIVRERDKFSAGSRARFAA